MYGRCSSSLVQRRLESLKLHRKRFADERRGFAVEDRRQNSSERYGGSSKVRDAGREVEVKRYVCKGDKVCLHIDNSELGRAKKKSLLRLIESSEGCSHLLFPYSYSFCFTTATRSS